MGKIAAAIAALAVVAFGPVAGQYSTGMTNGGWTVARFSIPEKLGVWYGTVWAPKTCTSKCDTFPGQNGFPTIIYASGFIGIVSETSMSELFTQVASHGIVVVGIRQNPIYNPRKAVDYLYLSNQTYLVEDYVLGNRKPSLADVMKTQGCTRGPSGKIFFSGHSSGNHIVAQRLVSFAQQTKSCSRYSGMIYYSPVDGGGSEVMPAIGKGTAEFITPVLIVSGSIEPEGGRITPSCAPADLGVARWYPASIGTTYAVLGTGFGHVDIMDEGNLQYAATWVCPAKVSKDQRIQWKRANARATVAFIDGLLNKNAPALAALGSQNYLEIPMTYTSKTGADNNQPGCTWIGTSTMPSLEGAYTFEMAEQEEAERVVGQAVGGTIGAIAAVGMIGAAVFYRRRRAAARNAGAVAKTPEQIAAAAYTGMPKLPEQISAPAV